MNKNIQKQCIMDDGKIQCTTIIYVHAFSLIDVLKFV